MIRYLVVILCFITISIGAQEEKRLALVIGNANYDKGALKNPVNDAELIKKTLEKLNFDVIFATNLELDRDMKAKIREFGEKRNEYNLGFVYYAGHGIQVGGENYLLPTKEKFNCENDVLEYGVKVQTIMNYLKSTTNTINILVLDACRNNPLEQNNCPNNSRSLKDGGLAKMNPTAGSLISFSTSANTTADDGIGENSLYCQSLAQNLLVENVSIYEIFNNVRETVMKKTNGRQIPEEASKLVGNMYYFLKNEQFDLAKKIMSMNKNELTLFLSAYENTNNDNSSKKVINYIQYDAEYYFAKGIEASEIKDYSSAIFYMKKAVELNSEKSLLNEVLYYNLGWFHKAIENYKKSIYYYKKSIEFNSEYAWSYSNLGTLYNRLEKYKLALTYLNKSIEIDPNNPYTFNSRGVAFKELKNYESALIDYNKAIKIDPNYGMAYGNRGNLKSMLDLPFCNDYKKACELGQKIVCEWYEDDCK